MAIAHVVSQSQPSSKSKDISGPCTLPDVVTVFVYLLEAFPFSGQTNHRKQVSTDAQALAYSYKMGLSNEGAERHLGRMRGALTR